MSNEIFATNYVGVNQPLTINATVIGTYDFADVVSYPCRLRNLSTGEETEYSGSRVDQVISFNIPEGVLDVAGRWRAICGALRTSETNAIPCTPIEFEVSEY